MSSTSNDNRLGRGLAALIGNTNNNSLGQLSPHPQAAVTAKMYQELPLSQIDVNPQQPRTAFDDEALKQLAESIRSVGVVQPVLVRRTGSRYELVAGERRFRAAKMAGKDSIPALIREADDGESLELALIENINREDLNPMDTARAYACLQEDFGITQEDLARKVGRSRPAVANTLRLLDLPGEVQKLIEAGSLSEGHGRALLSVPDRRQQKRLASRIASRGLSVRQAEQLARKEAEGSRQSAEPRNIPVRQGTVDEATDALYSAFRLPVRVRWTRKGGRIEIDFRNEEQLKRLIGVLEYLR